MKFKNIINHIITILKHKKNVFYYCNIAGITWRGIKHDMSKFSPIEFKESIKYYTGTSSPIDECKKENEYSLAWMHHKGHNDHHYEYWMDNFDEGGESIQMPLDCAIEMICDYLAAGKTYNENRNRDFTYIDELTWFIRKIDSGCAMHINTKKFTFLVLRNLVSLDNLNLKNNKYEKEILKEKYFSHEILSAIYYHSELISTDEFLEILDYERNKYIK